MRKGHVKSKAALIAILLMLIAAAGGALYRQYRREKPVHVVFISKTKDAIDFWDTLQEGATLAARDSEVSLSVVAPDQEINYEEQQRLFAAAIEERPDAIALAPTDAGLLLPLAQKAVENHIPLVLIDSMMEEDVQDCAVSTDNYAAGQALGKFILDMSEKKQQTVGIVSHLGVSSTAKERERGIRSVLMGTNCAVVSTVYGQSDYEKAYEETKKMLMTYPDITLIAGTNEYATVGAARAVRDMGQTDKVHIVGFDNSKEEMLLLDSGMVQAIVVQKAFDMGYLGIEAAVRLARGQQVESRIDSGFALVTKETMYTPENQKLLFPIK